jgi:hypothetical protein
MILKTIIEIITNWVLTGLTIALLLVSCFYFAIFCEKISDLIRNVTK